MATPSTNLYIDGKFVHSSNKETFQVRNPFSGETVGTVASASSLDCNAAIDAASKAFKTWEQSSFTVRRDILLRAADLVSKDDYQKTIMENIQQETAAPAYWGAFEWVFVTNYLRTVATMVDQLKGETYPSGLVPGAQVIAQRRAMGVIFGIVPWNSPFILTIITAAIPILCGNTIVLKGSELSPRSQALALRLFEDAGVPAGVVNFLIMSRENAPALSAEIIAHPAVRGISFTGSSTIGRIIAKEAAKHLKPCVLELGGKNAVIVLNDANIAQAAKAIVFGSMAHSGQVCMSTDRVIVQAGVAEKLISAVRGIAVGLKVGDVVNDPSVSLGARAVPGDDIVKMIDEARSAGGEVMLGDVQYANGMMKPHLVKGVKPGMRLWTQETFGPVAAFTVVDTINEAVEMANATEHSLTAALWTTDLGSAPKIASRIHAGYTNINGPTIHVEATDGLLGLGGESGYGRVHVENFTQKRVIVVHPEGGEYPL